MAESADSYYSALYADGETGEYCLTTNEDNQIVDVSVGGKDSWYMVGHVFFSHEFSEAFRNLMKEEYEKDETKQGYWEDLFIKHIDNLPRMKINRYKESEIKEFDSIDELRLFDESYKTDTRSKVVKYICKVLGVREEKICRFKNIKHAGDYLLFSFNVGEDTYIYSSENGVKIEKQ